MCQAVSHSYRFLFLRNASCECQKIFTSRVLVKLISCAHHCKRDCNALRLSCARCGPMQSVLVMRDPVVRCRGALQLRVCLSSCLCMCVCVYLSVCLPLCLWLLLCVSLRRWLSLRTRACVFLCRVCALVSVELCVSVPVFKTQFGFQQFSVALPREESCRRSLLACKDVFKSRAFLKLILKHHLLTRTVATRIMQKGHHCVRTPTRYQTARRRQDQRNCTLLTEIPSTMRWHQHYAEMQITQ